MSKRSIVIGLLCAVALCVVTYFNDMVMKGTYLVGNYLPVAVFGSLILFLLMVRRRGLSPCARVSHDANREEPTRDQTNSG